METGRTHAIASSWLRTTANLRQINAMVLIHSGYAVDVAEDGAAAWEALQANRYDLMITDNNMPRLTGIELLKELRSARMRLPVIMATTTLPTEELAQNPWLEPVIHAGKTLCHRPVVGYGERCPARGVLKKQPFPRDAKTQRRRGILG